MAAKATHAARQAPSQPADEATTDIDLADTVMLVRTTVDTPSPETTAVAAPVFVDASGTRRRRLRYLGFGAFTLLTVYGIALGLTFLGGPVPPHALLPIPGMPGSTASPAGAAVPGVVGGTATDSANSAASTTGAAAGSAASAAAPSPSGMPTPTPTPAASSTTTSHRPTVPPGQVGKSSAGGHGH